MIRRGRVALWFPAALLMAVGAAHGQEAPTTAVSRQVTMHAFGSRPTTAVSRQVTMHAFGSRPTIAVSRQVTMHIVGFPLTHATSRQVTYYLNFRLTDAVSALRIVAGLNAAAGPAATVYNVVGPGNAIDMSDAAEIARLAAGTVSRP